MRQRTPRQKLGAHLDFLRGLPCIVCGDNTSTEAAHIRMSDGRIVKHNAGVAAKPDDFFCLPVCGRHHREQHTGSESKFWRNFGIDPVLFALRLWSVTGDHDMGCQIVASANQIAAARVAANLLMAG